MTLDPTFLSKQFCNFPPLSWTKSYFERGSVLSFNPEKVWGYLLQYAVFATRNNFFWFCAWSNLASRRWCTDSGNSWELFCSLVIMGKLIGERMVPKMLRILASMGASMYFFYLAFSPNIKNEKSQFYSIILISVITLITSIFILLKNCDKKKPAS
ncbi:MAG TPA: hypothetical protein DEQ87_07450 [Algoriphagus sp.]|jgi:hypothetical protein|nr:hypothetical protein [Algoriphagus sp.]HCD87461.1 hypothetical protein [Algoriphagus sp.]HCH43296.1 hypothetical protein [Algoriphagus sp.]